MGEVNNMINYNQNNWDFEKTCCVFEKYKECFEEPVELMLKRFEELKKRSRYAVELYFKGWKQGVPGDEIFAFKKEIVKTGLFCGYCQSFFTVIVSPYPSIVNILCYMAVPSWENDIVRGLFFGYSKEEVNKFVDEMNGFKQKRIDKK